MKPSSEDDSKARRRAHTLNINAVRAFFSVTTATALALGCSRTGLDDDVGNGLVRDSSLDGVATDGTLDASSEDGLHDGPVTLKCSTKTCPGCCDSTGQCRDGKSSSFCGGEGLACDTCLAPFFCGGQDNGNACQKGQDTTGQCDALNCATGCCARISGVSQDVYCFQGDGDFACGLGGQPCDDCAANNDTCTPKQTCAKTVCGGGHCQSGCCLGSECLPGTGSDSIPEHAGQDTAIVGTGRFCGDWIVMNESMNEA